MKLSYLVLTTTDAAFNLAAEEYIFEHMPKDRMYVMLWQNAHAIIIGKHQNTLAEINSSFVNEQGIQVVRRLSGGGAVYHDLGNLNFTFIADAQDQSKINFSLFCKPVIESLKSFGIIAELNGRNDMTIDGKKFSGNSQYIRNARVMHHGTILFHSDLDVINQALCVDESKILAKGIKSVRSRVTNIQDHLTNSLSLQEFRAALLQSILSGHESSELILTPEDLQNIHTLCESKYRSWEWNYGHSKTCTMRKKRRFENCGTVEAAITSDQGRIQYISFYGDFFSAKDPSDLSSALCGCRLTIEDLHTALCDLDPSAYIMGMDKDSLVSLLIN